MSTTTGKHAKGWTALRVVNDRMYKSESKAGSGKHRGFTHQEQAAINKILLAYRFANR